MRRVARRTWALGALWILLAGLQTPVLAQGKVVNINTASVEQLTLLPRVGSVVAQRIVDFREKNGRFKSLEDLMLVQGVGEKVFELIRPYIALSGETTLTEKIKPPKSSGGGAS